MPEDIGVLRSRLEEIIRKEKFTAAEAISARADLEQRWSAANPSPLSFQQDVAQQAAMMRQDEAGPMGGIQSVKNAIGAFGGAAIDTGTLGYGPKLVGGQSGQAGIQAAREVHPIAGMAGDITGAVVSPITKALGAAGGMAAKAVGATKLVEMSAAAPFLARAAANAVQNFVSGGAAIGAMEASKSRPDTDGLALKARLRAAVAGATSPENIALSGALGAGVAKLQGRVSPEAAKLRPLMDRWFTLTGKRPNDAILTDDAARHSFLDTAARTPELADHARQIRDESISAMKALGSDIAQRNGARAVPMASEGLAASAIRRVTGNPLGTRETDNIVTKARRDMERPVMASFVSREVDPNLSDTLFRSARILAEKRPKTKEAPKIDSILGSLKAGLKDSPLYGRDLEGVRQQLGEIASTSMSSPMASGWTSQDRWEAKQLYNVVSHLIERADSRASAVLKTAGQMKVAEQALAGVKTSSVNRDAIDAFWRNKDVATNWDTVVSRGLPEDVDALRGDYIWRMVHSVTNEATGLVDGKLLTKITQQRGGVFNHQISERVAPGLARELGDLAKLSRIVGQGAVKAEGSDTARRGLQMTKTYGAPIAASGILFGLFHNPWATVAPLITAGVFKAAMMSAKRSMLTGAGQEMLANLALGGAPPAFAMPQLATQAAGAVPAAIQAGPAAIAPLAGAAGSVLGPAIGNTFTPVKERGK